jgi:hypothetical protein
MMAQAHQADLRCDFLVFFAASFAGLLPSIGISISFCPGAALRFLRLEDAGDWRGSGQSSP